MQKSVLIVTNKLTDMSQLQDMASALQFQRIDVASSVNMAVNYLREARYQLVVVAYDLGKEEKNGLQLVQEAQAEGLHLFSTLFVLLVEQDNRALLIGSLECAPDAYLSKPVSRAKLQAVLEKLGQIKQAAIRVEECMDSGDWQRALLFCDRLMGIYPGLRAYLTRLKGICLLQKGDYAEALQLFVEKKPVWAQVGLGMAYYGQGAFTKSVQVLQQVVDQEHVSVEAFAWLAKGLYVTGQSAEAVIVMRKAVLLQPAVPQLQGELANLAAYTGQWAIAVEAFRRVVKVARYSVFQHPDHYFGLVRALLALHQLQPLPIAALEGECIRVLEDVNRDFMDDPLVRFRAHSVMAQLRTALGNGQAAQAEQQQAIRWFKRLPLARQWGWLEWLQECVDKGEQAAAVAQLKTALLAQIRAEKTGWPAQLLHGIHAYKQGDFSHSCEYLCSALATAEQQPVVVLSWAQVALELRKEQVPALTQEAWCACIKALQGVNYGALSPKQYQRYSVLMPHISRLAQR